MDALSSYVSALKVATFHSTNSRDQFFQLKPTSSPSSSSNQSSQPYLYSTQHNSISNKTTYSTTTTTHKPNSTSFFLPTSLNSSNYQINHQTPATGYAAALVDIAQSNTTTSLDLLERDVQRFLKLLKSKQIEAVLVSTFMGEREKGQLVKKLVSEKGRFNRYLVRLVNMLVDKNKVGIVKQVSEEFLRIYDELSGTQVVLVPSLMKMEKDKIFGIAKVVQNLTGAMRVRVRDLAHENLPRPTFAL